MAKKQEEKELIVIRDLIYFDEAKAASILSQIEGGRISEIEASVDTTIERRNVRRYDLKVFAPEFGGTDTSVETVIERRQRHHEMCDLIERFLLDEKLAINLNTTIFPADVLNGVTHKLLSAYGYVKVTGWATIEDYTRLQFILKRYNSIAEFSARAQLENLPELQELKAQIELEAKQAELLSDRNQRSKAKQLISAKRKLLQEKEDEIKGGEQLQEWFLKGIDNFIETFLKGRINLFVFPFQEQLHFHAVANLKTQYFIDTDVESFIYAYGNRPNLELTLLGLITSLPTPDMKPLEFSRGRISTEHVKPDQLGIERSFSEAFDALQDLERLLSFSHFPNVTLYPIAVYREITNQHQRDSSVN